MKDKERIELKFPKRDYFRTKTIIFSIYDYFKSSRMQIKEDLAFDSELTNIIDKFLQEITSSEIEIIVRELQTELLTWLIRWIDLERDTSYKRFNDDYPAGNEDFEFEILETYCLAIDEFQDYYCLSPSLTKKLLVQLEEDDLYDIQIDSTSRKKIEPNFFLYGDFLYLTEARVLQETIGSPEDRDELDWTTNDTEHITELFLCNRRCYSKKILNQLPESFVELQDLEYIDLTFNNFEEFPTVLLKLPLLSSVNFSCNFLDSPLEIAEKFQHFEASNQILKFPEKLISGLKQIERPFYQWLWHDLYQRIGKLDTDEKQFLIDLFNVLSNMLEIDNRDFFYRKWIVIEDNYITELKLDDTRTDIPDIPDITILPKSVGNLVHLRKLDIAFHYLLVLPEEIGKLVQLEELNLQKNRILFLPESIGRLEMLKKLNLSSNFLTKLPESIGNLKSLQILDLSYQGDSKHYWNLDWNPKKGDPSYSIRDLPTDLQALGEKYLEEVKNTEHHPNNYKQKYNKSGYEMSGLLNLPTSFSQLHSLKELNLNNNVIKSLPETLANLKDLEKLMIGGNPLSKLPMWLLSHNKIQKLDIWTTNIPKVPKEILNMKSLQELEISNVPIEYRVLYDLQDRFIKIEPSEIIHLELIGPSLFGNFLCSSCETSNPKRNPHFSCRKCGRFLCVHCHSYRDGVDIMLCSDCKGILELS